MLTDTKKEDLVVAIKKDDLQHLSYSQKALMAAEYMKRNDCSQNTAAAMIGMTQSDVSKAVRILNNGTAEEIDLVRNGTLGLRKILKLIKERSRSLEPAKSIIERVRLGMSAVAKDQHVAAKISGITYVNYVIVSRLIHIAENSLLNSEDRNIIQECFDAIEHDGKIRESVKQKIAAVINEHWIRRKDAPYVIARRRKRYEAALMTIYESCESTANMELPKDLNRDEAFDAVGQLGKSMTLLGKLIQRLTGSESSEEE
jgi:hypothetical protein